MAVDRNEGLGNRPAGTGATGGDFSGGSHGAGGPFGGTAGGATGDPLRSGTTDAERDGESLKDRGEHLLDEGRERGEEMLREGRERASEAADAGRSRLAGKLEEFGGRLEERGRDAQQRGGIQGRAGEAAVRAGTALDSSAEYLRSHDVEDMRDDLERQIRERPLMSVGVALGAGFLLARILRD